MQQFGMISRGILLSSLATQIDEETGLPLARWVMMDLVVAAEANGCLHGAEEPVCRWINIPQDAFRRALEVLQAPDPGSRSRQEEGRRVLPLVDMGRGWRITTYQEYTRRAERGVFGLVSAGIFDTELSCALDQGLPVARWVAMDLITLADAEGVVEGTVETLSRRLNVPADHLDRALEVLESTPEWEPGIERLAGAFRVRTYTGAAAVRRPCAGPRAPVRPAHSYTRQDTDQTTPAAEEACAQAAHGDAAVDFDQYHPRIRAAWRNLIGQTGRGSGLSPAQKRMAREWYDAGVDLDFAVEVIRTTKRPPDGLLWFRQRVLDRWQRGRTLDPEPTEQLQLPDPAPVDEPESETQKLATLALGRSLRRDEVELARQWGRNHPQDHVAAALLYLGAREAVSGREGIGTLAYCADCVRDGPREEWTGGTAESCWGFLGSRWELLKAADLPKAQSTVRDLIASQVKTKTPLLASALAAGIGEGLNARWQSEAAA